MTRARRPTLSLIIAMVLFSTGVGLVYWLPPNPWSEPIVFLILALSIFLFVAWFCKSIKLGILITVGIVGIALMQRLRILDWLTISLWLTVVGLLTLIK